MSPVVDTGLTSWENKHETYRQPIHRLLLVQNDPSDAGDPLERYNGTTATLQSLIARALPEGVRLRAHGAGWSLSGAPATDGILLDTGALNLWFRVRERSIHPEYAGPRDGLFFLQCGNSVAGLNRNLRDQRRSLRATGASNGQTIVGAMSTGTHGSAIDLGAVQDHVVGIHLVASPTRHLWLERASRPVTVDGFAALFGAELRRDDEIFDAALVSFGAFGLIHGVLIETEPLFLFEMHRTRRRLDPALLAAIATLDLRGLALPGGEERPRHFEVLVNPYDLEGGAYLTTMYRRPFRPSYRRPVRSDVAPGDSALSFIGTLSDLVPPLIPSAVNLLVGGSYRVTDGPVEGTTDEIFSTTTTRGRAAGTAIALPVEHAVDALELILDINRRHGPFPCVLALRFVPRTRALLGFTRFQRSCVIDVDGPLSNRVRSFYSRIWQALGMSGIPYTMHWGKILGLGASEVRRLYGGDVDRWLAVRRELLDPGLRWLFSNRFLEELDLAG